RPEMGDGKEAYAVREEVSRVVHDVLRHGLKFKERVEANRPLSLDSVQAQLRSRLHGQLGREQAREANDYLGVRYPLACWLDEIFITDSSWARDWDVRKLETALYRTNDRARIFWEQSDLASARPDKDDLEVFLLCMLLGFRGDLRDETGLLQDKREKFESQLGVRRLAEWRGMPPELAVPPTDVPELHARERLRRLLMALGLIVGISIFLVSFLTVFSGP